MKHKSQHLQLTISLKEIIITIMGEEEIMLEIMEVAIKIQVCITTIQMGMDIKILVVFTILVVRICSGLEHHNITLNIIINTDHNTITNPDLIQIQFSEHHNLSKFLRHL